MFSDLSTGNIPAWLSAPPDKSFPALPVDTRLQTLPFGELAWENFERLIKRIVTREQIITDCWIYGLPGQTQFGLDILAKGKDDSGIFCYQCKRVKIYNADDINKAVDKFLDGKWATKCGNLVLCVSSTLSKTECVDEINRQIERLSLRNIHFEVWDGAEGGILAEKLKLHPDLVDDFFSREWVRRFNGEHAAEALGERLQGLELHQLRVQLNNIYKTLFLRHDPGLRLGSQRPASLISRYIPPVVIETRNIITTDTTTEEKVYHHHIDAPTHHDSKPSPHSKIKTSSSQEIRISLGEWFSRHHRSVVLGEPGFGKSTLLRVLALQLLSAGDEPIKNPWNDLLPVWISFGGFSSAVQTHPGLSLEDYFDNWLHQNAADDVRPLFRRAIKQSGLLLLIDGLDEGQDVDAAKQAMDRISAFLAIRSVPAIFTSRPRGYERVRPDGNWPVTRLGAFDKNQIEKFATMWFEYLESPLTSQPDRISGHVQLRTSDFLKAAQVNSRIIELAQTPLFCQLLIDIFRFSHHLPEQRIKVYEKIIDLLLSDHPSARSQASGITGNLLPRAEDMRQMLMRLALSIQEAGGAGVISVEACQASFCSFLTDDLNGPGLSNYDAKYQASIITDYALAGLGLMTERAPDELGFFHLTIQEYLAAQAMIRKEEEQQLIWLVRVWNLPQWHEVVLAWFSIRGMDQGKGATQRAIDRLKESALSPWESLQLLVLRTELAANDLGLSPREARATIEQAAIETETTPFPKIRLVLSGYITQGLRSSSVNSLCEHYITRWVPARNEWDRSRLISQLSHWKPSDDLLNALKLCLHDESLRCRWSSAESLAALYLGDEDIGRELLTKARDWPDVNVRAAALYCLWMGWRDHEMLDSLAEVASHSPDPGSALVGILIKISRNHATEQDCQRVCHMYFDRTVPYDLEGFCCDILVKGWSKDERLKKQVLEHLNIKRNSGIFETERFIFFLTRAWPGDDKVSHAIIDHIRKYASGMMHVSGLWKTIASNFSGNKELIALAREILKERKEKFNAIYWGQDVKHAYLFIGDEAAKAELLKAFSSTNDQMDKHWICATLMDGWPDDAEVRQLLTDTFLKSPGENAELAAWVHLFIHDKDARRLWLLEAAKSGSQRSNLPALSHLLDEFKDEECIDAVWSFLSRKHDLYSEIEVKNKLVTAIPDDPQVSGWVEKAFKEIDGISLAVIAMSHEDNMAVRRRILDSICPIHSEARREIFRIIRETLMPPAMVIRVTSQIFAETNPLIRTSGLIARCIASQHDPEVLLSFQHALLKELNAVGMSYEMRRRSAYSALLYLKCYDECADYLCRENKGATHWLSDHLQEDVLSTRIMFENWPALKNRQLLLQEEFEINWSIFIHNGAARGGVMDDYVRHHLIDCLKQMSVKEHSAQSLYLMADLLPASPELQGSLIELMSQTGNNSHHSYEKLTIAQSIYAEQFSGITEAYQSLAKLWISLGLNEDINSENLFNILYALITGWPHSVLVQSYIDNPVQPKVVLHAALVLSGLTGNIDRAQRCIEAMSEEVLNEFYPFTELYAEALRKWSASSSTDILLHTFLNESNPTNLITALKLLSFRGKAEEELRLRMVGIFNQQLNGESEIIEGIDVFRGKVASVVQVIADEFILMTP